MTAVYVRNLHPTQRLMVPIAPGWARLLLPSVTAAVPAQAAESPIVRRMLAAQVLAVVGEAGWNADARQRQADRFGMEELIRAAEQREFDGYRLRQRPARRTPSAPGSPGHHAGRWPDEKNAQFKVRWASGVPLDTLAVEFNVSRGSIIDRAGRLGLPSRVRTWTAERIERVTTLWTSGALLAQIAAELGVSASVITSMRWKLKLPPRPAIGRRDLLAARAAPNGLAAAPQPR